MRIPRRSAIGIVRLNADGRRSTITRKTVPQATPLAISSSASRKMVGMTRMKVSTTSESMIGSKSSRNR